MSAQILFTGLDGTLLDYEKSITPGNRKAVEEALALGKRIVVTSGRPLSSSLEQARRLELAGRGCYVIAYNGAEIYDCTQGETLFRRTLELEDVYAVFDEAKRRGVYIQTYDRTRAILEDWCDPAVAKWYCDRLGMGFSVIGDVRRDLAEAPVKMLLIDRSECGVLDEMKDWIDAKLAGRVDCFHSSGFFLEVVAAGINKGMAVEELCRVLDIPIAESVAAGDEANDISMIQAAGVGAAMVNGTAAVKAAADYVTERDNNHDGVEEIIRKFLL